MARRNKLAIDPKKVKRRTRELGNMLLPAGLYPESDEMIRLRKFRSRLAETKEALDSEIPYQPSDWGQILEIISGNLKTQIGYLNDMLSLDRYGNDKESKPKFKYQTSINEKGEIEKTKIKL